MPTDLDTLNKPQREAVLCTEGPLLVLAGAGSGKTRVLTYRIAHLIEDKGVMPWQILAITFTNKAAREMRERISSLIGPTARGMWVATFHSVCVRILRSECERMGFSAGFTIYDDSDSKRLVKEIMNELDISTKVYPIQAIRNQISTAKNDLVMPGEYEEKARLPIEKMAARVYRRLQERMKAANAFDFDDLLLYTYLLFKHYDDVLQAYQDRFRYLLVDEYQDTNHAQYTLTTMLAAKHKNIMIVGDDDQSIYSWRGADIRNILEFESDYPEAHVVKLEQNYRSCGNILSAANAVIANNETRKEKKLFTDQGAGDKVAIYMASDERDEGRWIAGEIEKLHAKDISYNDVAVFYRTNAQSRMLEDMLLRAGAPYKIVGGTKFFDRAEIRDVIAYLTLVVNPADDIAAKRVINVPRRGIGKTTIERIEQDAIAQSIPFMEAAELAIVESDFRASTKQALAEFVQLCKDAASYEGELRDVVEMIVERSGLISALKEERSDEVQARVENIQEFYSVVKEYSETHDAEEADFEPPTVEGSENTEKAPEMRTLSGSSLADFLEWIALRTDLDTMTDSDQAVTLMTIHSAKGLEFDNVFVAGMEEGLFPHASSANDPAGIEEERRLAYVAITRARKNLHLTCASSRQIFGQTSSNPLSRFIGEIPSELRDTTGLGSAGLEGTGWEKRGSRNGIAGSGSEAGGGRVFGGSGGARVNPNAGKKAAANMTFAPGDRVDHKTFGRGKITKVDGDDLHVVFDQSGKTKKLMKDFAPIVKIS